MNDILEILNDLGVDADVENCTTLIDDGILASMDILNIISELSDTFNIHIPAKEITPENFNSAAALWEMVQRLMDE